MMNVVWQSHTRGHKGHDAGVGVVSGRQADGAVLVKRQGVKGPESRSEVKL